METAGNARIDGGSKKSILTPALSTARKKEKDRHPEEGVQRCSQCKEVKPQNQFYFNVARNITSSMCKSCHSKTGQEYEADPEIKKRRGYQKWVHRAAYKVAVLVHYGGENPKCACCGECRVEFLAIDHTHGDGGTDRKVRGDGAELYRSLVKDNFPPGYRVLSHNCNSSGGMYGRCAHNNPEVIFPKLLPRGRRAEDSYQESIMPVEGWSYCLKCKCYKPSDAYDVVKATGKFFSWCKPCRRKSANQRYQENYQKKRVEALSKVCGGPPKCNCCGETAVVFLSVHHVNGRDKKAGKRGNVIYEILKSDCLDGFRVLCYNCHYSMTRYGYCPHTTGGQRSEHPFIAMVNDILLSLKMESYKDIH